MNEVFELLGSSRRSSFGRRFFATSLLVLAGCSGGSAQRPRVAPADPTTTSTTRPRESFALKLPPGISLVARATVARLLVYSSPKATRVLQTLDNPWLVDPQVPSSTVPQVFLVQGRRGDWVKVLLPIRPNGSVGWVRAGDVTLTEVRYHIRVELAAHRITVFVRNAAVYQGTIADGEAATPTPTGRYYLRVLMKAPDPNTVYGPYAYGLSSHSDVLTSFAGADGEIGIHGNNDVTALGRSVTHGCIRMDNDEISRLAGILPLGTPVEIVA